MKPLTQPPQNLLKIHAEDIPALTGLRGFAALWVLILHACFGDVNEYGYFPAFDHKLDWGLLENFITMEGNVPVSLFFVLSGFIMAHVYGQYFQTSISPKITFIFYVKRLARIYPVHLLITLVLTALYYTQLWQPIRPFDFEDVLLSAGLLNVFKDPSVNMPAWSVSAEWIAYLLCPFILYFFAKIKKTKFDLLAILALCFLYPYLFQEFFCCLGRAGAGAILHVISEFLIGIFLYRLHQQKAFVFQKEILNDLACLCLFATLIIISIFFDHIEITQFVFPFILYYLANSAGFMKDFFASRIMIFLGLISYCLYLVHYPVLEIFTAFSSEFLYSVPEDYAQLKLWGLLGIVITTALLLASMLYYLIERPSRWFVVKKLQSRAS